MCHHKGAETRLLFTLPQGQPFLKSSSSRQVRVQTEAKYTSIWHCIRDTYRQERVGLEPDDTVALASYALPLQPQPVGTVTVPSSAIPLRPKA